MNIHLQHAYYRQGGNRVTGARPCVFWAWVVPWILAALLALAVFWLAYPLPGSGASAAIAAEVTGPAEGTLLQEIRDIITREYVLPVTPEQLMQNTPEEIIASLGDPYSQYFTAEDFRRFVYSVDNSFGGVGMQVEFKGGYVTVVAPLKDTPAERAGVRTGDRVLKVDGRDVVGLPLEVVVGLIQGEPGSQVTLELERTLDSDRQDNLVLVITRELIRIQVLESRMLDPGEAGEAGEGIGYIELTAFSSGAAPKLRDALADLNQKEMRALILDLRNNPGGYLDVAQEVASALLGKGKTVVRVVDRDNKPEALVSRGPGLQVPLTVLVNGGSASASEIVAGAVQDHQAGLLVGTRTFGKASVQTLIPLSDGGALKLTTAHYLTPSGRQINGQGLKPDLEVTEPDYQLARAISEVASQLAELEARAVAVRNNGGNEGDLAEDSGSPVAPAAAAAAGGLRQPLEVRLWPGRNEARFNSSNKELPSSPYVVNGVTMVPLRWVAESFGWTVTWSEELRRAALLRSEQGEAVAAFYPGQEVVRYAGQEVRLLQSPVLIGGVTFVPVRPLSQFLGAQLSWDPATGEVVLTLGQQI